MTRRKKIVKEKEEIVKAFKINCEGKVKRFQNWKPSSSITYEYVGVNLGDFRWKFLIDENGRAKGLEINYLASFIKNQMILGDCIVIADNKANEVYNHVYDFLLSTFEFINSQPQINWVARDEENSHRLREYVLEANSNVITLK